MQLQVCMFVRTYTDATTATSKLLDGKHKFFLYIKTTNIYVYKK